jgi:hypothetical protein
MFINASYAYGGFDTTAEERRRLLNHRKYHFIFGAQSSPIVGKNTISSPIRTLEFIPTSRFS